jgi:hypothetical protein
LYCYWGWPKPIADIYRKFVVDAGESAMKFGPGHIVWEDENFDRESIQWCLENFNDYRWDYSDKELEPVRKSLEELLKLPDSILDTPDEYDGENPNKFPPTTEMVSKDKLYN